MIYHEEIDRARKEMLSISDWQWFDRDQQIEQRKRIDKAVSLLERDAFRSGYEAVAQAGDWFAKIFVRYAPEKVSISDETLSAVREARENMPKWQFPMVEQDDKPGRVEIAFVDLLRLVASTRWEDGARAARED